MTSLREELAAAMDAEDATPAAAVETTSEPAAAAVETASEPAAAAAPAGETVRDGLGRFVPKDPQGVAKGPAGGQATQAAPTPLAAPGGPSAAPTAAPTAADAVAPVSWRPEVKAEWAALPPAVRAEVARREADMTRAMSENASARGIASQFTETVTPYLPFMRAEGASTPLEAIRNVFDTVVQLRTGTQFQKAETILRLINAYGVDVEALDNALVGKAQEDPRVQMQREIDARVQAQLAPFQQFMTSAQQHQAAQAQAISQEVTTELAAFAAPRPHFETVRAVMADLMDSAQRNKFDLSMVDAYDQAVRLHPATAGSTIVAQAVQTAQQLNSAAQRAKRASVAGRVQSQSSTAPAGDGGQAAQTLRGAIQQAMQDVPLA